MMAEPISNIHSIQGEQFSQPEIPKFEGEEVAATKGKITSVNGLEVGDQVFRMDETVRMVVECRVIGVEHKANAKGDLERVHNFKAVDSVVIDWALDLDQLRSQP